MWQRFNERARRAIFQAQEEAAHLGQGYVATEHLLLAITRDEDCAAMSVLNTLGISAKGLRWAIDNQAPRGDSPPGQEVQLTPQVKRVMDLAYDEALQLHSDHIGTEHLLLGLVRERDGFARRILLALGLDLDHTRLEVVMLQEKQTGAEESGRNRSITVDDLRRRVERKADLEIIEQRLSGANLPAAPGVIRPGDLGLIVSTDGRSQSELCTDASALLRLEDVFAARDAHGYRAMVQTEKAVSLVSLPARVKVLMPPPDTDPNARRRGRYVRVLDGFYEGRAGWIFRECFEVTGRDEGAFPPAVDE